jgi:hypothetical protein
VWTATRREKSALIFMLRPMATCSRIATHRRSARFCVPIVLRSDQPNRCTNAGCAPMAGGPGLFCDGTRPRMTAHHRSSERVSLSTI